VVDALDHFVCGDCGLLVAPGKGGNYFHVEEPPEKWDPHDVTNVTTRREYLFGQSKAPEPPVTRSVTAQERQARALERIADAVEMIAQRLDSTTRAT
jgi:hypothetical protein